jgi:hypothetical protein
MASSVIGGEYRGPDMTTDNAIRDLLVRAKAAHGDYEREELGGIYDEQWPRWYATFLVNEGLAASLRRPVSADDLATLLSDSWSDQQRSAPDEPWESFTARRIQAELVETSNDL